MDPGTLPEIVVGEHSLLFAKIANTQRLCVRKDYVMRKKKTNVNMIQILIQSSFRMDLSKIKNCFAVSESKWEILLENMDAAFAYYFEFCASYAGKTLIKFE